MCICFYIFSRLGSKHHVQTPWLQAPCANICWLACCNMIYNHNNNNNNNNNNNKNNNIYIYIYIYTDIHREPTGGRQWVSERGGRRGRGILNNVFSPPIAGLAVYGRLRLQAGPASRLQAGIPCMLYTICMFCILL